MVQTNVRHINLLDVNCLQINQPKPRQSIPALPAKPTTPSSQPSPGTALPPGPPPGHPPVIPILHPPDRRDPVGQREQSPPAPKLPKHPVDPRRPLKPPPPSLHRPRRPRDLRASEPQPLDQPLLLARPNVHPSAPIPTPNPPRQPITKPALPVVHQRQTVACHRPKLH